MKLTGNTILTIGGTSGIGRAFAVALLKLGNRVLVSSRHLDALPAGAVGIAADVSKLEDVEQLSRFDMKLADFIKLSLKGIAKNRTVINPGGSKMMKIVGRMPFAIKQAVVRQTTRLFFKEEIGK